MTKLGYAQQLKQNQLNQLSFMVAKAGEADLTKLKQICFEKMGLGPQTVDRYLKELAELGRVHIIENENLIRSEIYVKEMEEGIRSMSNETKKQTNEGTKKRVSKKKTRT